MQQQYPQTYYQQQQQLGYPPQHGNGNGMAQANNMIRALPMLEDIEWNEQGFIPAQELSLEHIKAVHKQNRKLLANLVSEQSNLALSALIVRTLDPLQDQVNYPDSFIMGGGTPGSPLSAIGNPGAQGNCFSTPVTGLGWTYIPIDTCEFEQFFRWDRVPINVGVMSLGVGDAGDPVLAFGGTGTPGFPPRLAAIQMQTGAAVIDRIDTRRLFLYGESLWGFQGYYQKNYAWLTEDVWELDHLYEDRGDFGAGFVSNDVVSDGIGIQTPELAYIVEQYGKTVAIRS